MTQSEPPGPAGSPGPEEAIARHSAVTSRAQREVESGIERDFSTNLSYGEYLDLERVLSAQHPRSVPAQHDEMLFIIQHQTSELWLKLMLHELRAARHFLATDQPRPALKGLARIKRIQETLTEQWAVLATLTPSEYAQFRSFLATGSGFQSAQYREVEFLLGNKSAQMLRVFEHDPQIHAQLSTALVEPSVYDEFLAWIARRGHAVPREVLERDVTQPYEASAGVVDAVARIYADPTAYWEEYEACEELVDLEDNFQVWRFKHLRTVQRIIGGKPGTGGSSGVPFLRRALDLTFFPELYDVRSQIQDVGAPGYHGGEPT